MRYTGFMICKSTLAHKKLKEGVYLTVKKYAYVRKVFHHLEQNFFTAASNLVRPAKRY